MSVPGIRIVKVLRSCLLIYTLLLKTKLKTDYQGGPTPLRPMAKRFLVNGHGPKLGSRPPPPRLLVVLFERSVLMGSIIRRFNCSSLDFKVKTHLSKK